MSDIDKKLLEVIEDNQYIDGEFSRYATPEAKEEACNQIKQAFKDAGYASLDKQPYRDRDGREYTQYTMNYPDGRGEFMRVPINYGELMTRAEWEQQALKDGWVKVPQASKDRDNKLMVDGKRVMTGQEWYDRFKSELANNYDLSSPEFTSVQAIEAAMKASGLS